MPQRFEATWNVKLGAAVLAIPMLMIGLIVGTDTNVPFAWRGIYVLAAVVGSAGCWRWSRSHCLIEDGALTVVGIVRKRRYDAGVLAGAEVEAGGVPTLALHDRRPVRVGFLRVLFGRQRRRADDFAAAVNSLATQR